MVTNPDRRSAKAQTEARKRSERAERRRAHQATVAKQQEAADEAIAPAVQRLGVGTKAPRLVRDGITFRRACPIEVMIRQGVRRSKNGDQPTLAPHHGRAVTRLYNDWEMCRTVTFGISAYGERSSGTPQTGYISPAILWSVEQQRSAAEHIEAIRVAMGPLWEIIDTVALQGVDVSAWAAARRFDVQIARGMLRAALDVLVAHYASLDDRASRARAREDAHA